MKQVNEKVSFYRYSKSFAKNNGCLDRWQESHEANIACAQYIDNQETGAMSAVKDKRADSNLEYCEGLIERFGYARTMCVIAANVRENASDDCIANENKDWAKIQLGDLRKPQTQEYILENTHPAMLDTLAWSIRHAYDEIGLFKPEHCDRDNPDNSNYEGKLLVIRPSALNEQYWSPRYQLFVAKSGFGCDPNASGRAVFGEYLIDGEQTRMNRGDFYGVINDEHIPDWAREKLEQMNQPEQADMPENTDSQGMIMQ
ncbi:MAG: DUF3849 domain-containing protein [Oscillospiraceae bacterium]|nr:DUF3849 domain-containing protein [Oscillospiraceae bacterium]